MSDRLSEMTYPPTAAEERDQYRASAEQATQALGVLVARQGGEVALTDADLEDIEERTYDVLVTRDEAHMRTVIKAVRR